ncbi:MAG TPA: hypothetical protein VI278_17060 [Nitrososphaeraceae archaeon]
MERYKNRQILIIGQRHRAADAQTERLLALVSPESQANAMSDLPMEDLTKVKKRVFCR